MIYNDEQLATPEQMNEMAKAYKTFLNAKVCSNNKDNFSAYKECCHLFNTCGYLANKLLTGANGKKLKQVFLDTHSLLLKNAKLFYSYFESSPTEEEIIFSRNFLKSTKLLIVSLIELANNLTPLASQPTFQQMIAEILQCSKQVITLL